MSTDAPEAAVADEIEYDLEATFFGRRYLLTAHGDRPGYACVPADE